MKKNFKLITFLMVSFFFVNSTILSVSADEDVKTINGRLVIESRIGFPSVFLGEEEEEPIETNPVEVEVLPDPDEEDEEEAIETNPVEVEVLPNPEDEDEEEAIETNPVEVEVLPNPEEPGEEVIIVPTTPEVDDNKQPTVEEDTNKVITETATVAPKNGTTVPNTGVHTDLAVYMGLAAISLIGLAYLTLRKQANKNI